MNWDWTLEFRGMTLAKESFESFAQRRGELYCGQVQYHSACAAAPIPRAFSLPHRTPQVRLEATQGWLTDRSHEQVVTRHVETSNRSGRSSAVSRSIHKSKTFSFRAGKGLSNNILVLKIDWQMTLQCLWRCRAASVFDQSRNRCVGKLREGAVSPFLVRFTKAKHARLEQKKIFPATSWFRKSTKKWRCSARLKLPVETGNRSTSQRANHDTLSFGLLCFGATATKITTGQVKAYQNTIPTESLVFMNSYEILTKNTGLKSTLKCMGKPSKG